MNLLSTEKFYKMKDVNGEYLGCFIFSVEKMDTYGRNCDGTNCTLLYFMPNNSKTWNHVTGKLVHSNVKYGGKNQEIPDNIEETDERAVSDLDDLLY
jgi:hypothetical protein